MYSYRSHIIQLAFIVVGIVLLARLFFIQVLSQEYQFAAEKNIIQPTIEHPYRGAIYDRHGQFLTYNVPVYDLLVTPKEVKHTDIQTFCKDFDISEAYFRKSLARARKYSSVKPSLFLKNVSQETWAKAQGNFSDYLGFSVQARTVREYPHPVLANTLGYVGEVSTRQLKQSGCVYKKGDLVGIGGLEQTYDRALRGAPGIQYTVSDVRGRSKGRFKGGKLDRAATPGKSLKTTIDLSLQVYAERLMKGKIGSIVALDPRTGEVLTMVSSPSYDPNLLRGRKLGSHFSNLEKSDDAPLFHRPIMAAYPPGSIFKLNQALIALEEGLINGETTYACRKKPINCHDHPSPLNLSGAIQHSCNPYFYHVFQRILNPRISASPYQNARVGLEKWYAYLKEMGFGVPLGIDMPGEKSGAVPNVDFYDRLYGKMRWKSSTVRSLDIGQGELLVTPLQMANFAATVANRGYYFTPHLVRKIGDQPASLQQFSTKHTLPIKSSHFELLASAMQAGVERGTSRRVCVSGIDVCAKTGTAENPHGEDHSICIAFAPKNNPQIALAVCVENAGWGGRAAAAVSGLLVEQYLRGSVSRPWMENYVLKGDFLH